MAQIKSIQKIEKIIEDSDKPICITHVVQQAGLDFKSVREIVAYLESLNKIQVVSNGRVTILMKTKQVMEAIV